MKRIIASILVLITICFSAFCAPVNAETLTDTKVTVETLANGDYIETIIVENTLTRSTKTATKTTNYKNSAGTVMWYVSVTGRFSYNELTCICLSYSHNAKSNASAWKILSSSSSSYVNTATATATARFTTGSTTSDYTRSVTLTCDNYGNLS